MPNITLYKDINEVLKFLTSSIASIFQQNLVGLYLTGSLTYNDFNISKSDVDLFVVLNHEITEQELGSIKALHKKIEKDYLVWGKRLECSYITRAMLKSKNVPQDPRPYYNSGTFFEKARFSNEWVINNYLLLQHGIALLGPDFKKLTNRIEEIEVKQACIRDLFDKWIPQISDTVWLSSESNQCYFVFNLCRILHAVVRYPTGSKTLAAKWVTNEFPQWYSLISQAENFNDPLEIKSFLRFVVDKISNN